MEAYEGAVVRSDMEVRRSHLEHLPEQDIDLRSLPPDGLTALAAVAAGAPVSGR